MIIQQFELKDKTPNIRPPAANGWEQLWSGYYCLTECMSQEKRQIVTERDQALSSEGIMNETDFQENLFLNILADIDKDHVDMFELGAGWGRICLNLAGVIDFKIIPIKPVSYRCLAIEGEPTHHRWINEHFEKQGINGINLYGAVSDKNGVTRFLVVDDPGSQYGQAMAPLTGRSRLPSIQNIKNLLTGKTVKVPMFQVDRLMEDYEFEHLDILQMDVQGAEDKVIKGAYKSLKNDLIDYIMINVHGRELGELLEKQLTPDYELVINILRESIGHVDGFPPVRCHDGLQLYKRRNM